MMKRLFTNKTLSPAGGRSYSNRAISLLLCFALLLTMMPQVLLFPVHSVESDQGSAVTETPAEETTRFDHMIGRVATFSDYYVDFTFAANPAAVTDYDQAPWTNVAEYSVYDYPNDDGTMTDEEYWALIDEFYTLEMVITDCFVSEEDHGALWFKVEPADGVTLPEILMNNPWIFAFYSGIAGEEQSIFLNVENTHLETGVVVEGDLPAGAEISVEIPTIDGVALPNVFDIKVLVPNEDGDLVEWQPIDEGKTVQLSIPVEGDIATVTHFVDYAKAIHEGLTFESTEGAEGEVLDMLKPAIDAYEEKYGTRDHIALEILEEIPIVDGVATVTTNSFSIYTAEGVKVEHTALFLNTGEGTDNGQVTGYAPATQVNGVWDNGKYYIYGGTGQSDNGVTIQIAWEGASNSERQLWWWTSSGAYITVIKRAVNGELSTVVNNEEMGGGETGEISGRKIGKSTFTVDADTQTGTAYIVTVTGADGRKASVEFIIADIDSEYTATFADPNGYLKDFSQTALKYKFDGSMDAYFPEVTANEGYAFTGWLLSEPAGDWSSDGTLYDKDDELSNHVGNVVFIPQVTPNYKYKVNFVTDVDVVDGTMPKSVATDDWLSSGTYTHEWDITPVAVDSEHYTFMGWSVSTGGTLTEYDQQLTVIGTPAGIVTVTLTAVWQHKDDKSYTVEHYYESLEPGEYELVEVETLYGIEGNNTAAKANNPVGFTAPATVTQEVITGDTTVVKIYYTRNTYIATWYVDGSGTPVTYKYGATIELLATPTKTGYIFDRWDGYTAGMTMPASDVGFTALWHLKTLAIYFESNGGTPVAPIEQPYGSKVTAPDAPTKTGYTFAGWYEDDKTFTKEYSFNTMPATDTTLYAKWNINSYDVTYESIFDLDSNKFTKQTVPYMGTVTIHAEIPVQEGYTFLGWMCDMDSCATCSSKRFHRADTDTDATFTMPAANVILTAQWDPTPFILTYTGEGVTEETFIHNYNDSVTIKENPEREGFTFQGWLGTDGNTYWGGKPFDMPARDFTMTAQWTPITYTIIFDPNGGDGTMTSQSFTYDVAQSLTANAFTRTGYIFAGWNTQADGKGTGYADKASVKNLTSANGATVTLYAQWTPITYTVIFDANDGEGTMTNQIFTYDVAQTLKANGFTRSRYTFTGWNTAADGSGTAYTNMQQVENLASTQGAEITLYAQWKENIHTVTFTIIIQGESETTVIQVKEGSDVLIAFAPVSDHLASVTIKAGSKAEEEVATGVYGYLFTAENITSDVSIKIVAYAEVKTVVGAIDHGTVALNPNDLPDNYLPYGGNYTLTFTTDDGYQTDEVTDSATSWNNGLLSFSGAFTDNRAVVVDTKPIMYTITYDLAGGVLSTANPENYTIESGSFTLINPTRQGYIFAGWIGTGLSEPTMTVTIEPGSTGDRTYTATWKITSLTISVDGETVDSADAFVYQISSDGMDTLTVVARKGAPVTIEGLIIGKQYTITQLSTWSWKYGASPEWVCVMGSNEQSATGNAANITLTEAATITFTNALEKDYWLGGESSCEYPTTKP